MASQYTYTIATRFFNQPNSNFWKLLHWNRFDRQSEDFPLVIDLPDALIVDKPTYSCVTPEFISCLQGWGVSEVHICGIDTDICVMKCAVDLFEHGFRPVVLGATCASTAGQKYHEAALKILIRYIGSEQVIIS